jgi:hypothetical protein
MSSMEQAYAQQQQQMQYAQMQQAQMYAQTQQQLEYERARAAAAQQAYNPATGSYIGPEQQPFVPATVGYGTPIPTANINPNTGKPYTFNDMNPVMPPPVYGAWDPVTGTYGGPLPPSEPRPFPPGLNPGPSRQQLEMEAMRRRYPQGVPWTYTTQRPTVAQRVQQARGNSPWTNQLLSLLAARR